MSSASNGANEMSRCDDILRASATRFRPAGYIDEFAYRAQLTKLGFDAAEVAKEGFEALMAGKDHIIAGSFKNKLQAAAGQTLPEPMVAKAHAGMSAPGSGKK